MRQETNNEMDLLLRRLGRRQENSVSGDHLDADELSSYAENVLPPAARARYTEHLAECARCRDLVVQLSSSAGVVVAQETARVFEPSALRKFLASLFSPMVLRYAVPALGLVVVAAIGLMVSRNEQRDASISQLRQQESPPVAARENQSQPSSPTEKESDGVLDRKEPANKATAQGDNDAGAGPAPAAPPPPNIPPTVSSVTAEVQDTAKKVEQQQEEAKEAAPLPKPTATDQLQKLEPGTKQPAESREVVANEAPPEKSKDQNRSAKSLAVASPQAASRRDEFAGVGAASAGAGRSTLRRDDEAEKDKNDADTRTVAGRRFRKQGNAWIDTAYDSSRRVTDVRRGSEQYRVLIGDEPAIKQIADQLDGEIIVVWKSSTYRIR